MSKVLAIVPARAGSKRLPGKNKALLHGFPLFLWSVKAGYEAKKIDKVVVSTDDSEILSICKSNNIDTIIRPEELANDTATSIDVVLHALRETDGEWPHVVLLQPTSPLRTAEDIDAAITKYFSLNADCVVSVCRNEHPVQWMNILPKDLSMTDFLKEEYKGIRSQDFEPYYRINGAIYITRVEKMIKEHSLYIKENSYAYIMPFERSIDIDTETDFKIAEVFYGLK